MTRWRQPPCGWRWSRCARRRGGPPSGDFPDAHPRMATAKSEPDTASTTKFIIARNRGACSAPGSAFLACISGRTSGTAVVGVSFTMMAGIRSSGAVTNFVPSLGGPSVTRSRSNICGRCRRGVHLQHQRPTLSPRLWPRPPLLSRRPLPGPSLSRRAARHRPWSRRLRQGPGRPVSRFRRTVPVISARSGGWCRWPSCACR